MASSVLVVEDDAAIRKGLTALLRMGGHEVAAVETVAAALSHLGDSTPTHLLLDLNLPDLPGTSLLRHIRGLGLPIRVALLTGASDTALLAEARALTVVAVFIKPPDWDALLEWVGRL